VARPSQKHTLLGGGCQREQGTNLGIKLGTATSKRDLLRDPR